MIISLMPSNEYNAKCKLLSTKCTNVDKLGNICNMHTSKLNLEKISTTLKSIMKQSEKITKDWESKN